MEDDEVTEKQPYFPPELKLYVGNLPFNVDSSRLAGLFQQAGNVEMVEVIFHLYYLHLSCYFSSACCQLLISLMFLCLLFVWFPLKC